jgi:hypothetical protein
LVGENARPVDVSISAPTWFSRLRVRLVADAGNITLVVQDGRIVKHPTQTAGQ